MPRCPENSTTRERVGGGITIEFAIKHHSIPNGKITKLIILTASFIKTHSLIVFFD